MPDLDMGWAGDLSVSPTGDLALIVEPDLGTERILRRLLTNPGDYLWNPSYGAGLAQFVGQPASSVSIETLVRQQMQLEDAVSPTPEPVITVSIDVAGRLYLQIRYEDSVTATSSNVSANIAG